MKSRHCKSWPELLEKLNTCAVWKIGQQFYFVRYV